MGGTFGSNSNDAFGFQLVEDFTVPASDWNAGKLTFYAYQTGSTLTSTITGVPLLLLWNGPPATGGTVIVGAVSPAMTNGSEFFPDRDEVTRGAVI